MKFDHEPIEINYELEAETSDTGRVYKTPEGNAYPSITTVLGKRAKAAILAWRKRVGEEEANRVSRIATSRGTKVHHFAEDYLNNETISTDGEMPHVLESWNSLKPMLENHVGTVRAQEVPLYSDILKVAGRVDLVGEWDDELAIIDFKTSKRIKEKHEISNYFMQACAYAMMLEERTGICINKLVVAMVADGGFSKVFVEEREDWIDKLIEEITYYYEHRYD